MFTIDWQSEIEIKARIYLKKSNEENILAIMDQEMRNLLEKCCD